MKYHGMIGFSDEVETSPDVWTQTTIEYPYYGDVLNVSRGLSGATDINDSVTVSTKISIVADAYAMDHFFNMRYIHWQNTKWKVANVSVEPPRLILTLGGLYNGPTSS